MNLATNDSRRYLSMKEMLLVSVNGFFLLAVLALGFLVDGNGRILGLSAATSSTVTAAVFVAAFVVAGLLLGKGHGGWLRGLGIAIMVLYVAMLLPALSF